MPLDPARGTSRGIGFQRCYPAADLPQRRMNMQKQPFNQMTSENVEEFEVRILDSHDLVISIVLVHAPWSVTTEIYQISY